MHGVETKQRQTLPGKVAELAAEATTFGQREGKEKWVGPVVVEVLEPLGAKHVAVREPLVLEAGHVADQVQWEDAPDTLPIADHEPFVPEIAELGGQTEVQSQSEASPAGSSVGPSESPLSTDLDDTCVGKEECGTRIGLDGVCAGEEEFVSHAEGYVCISVSDQGSTRGVPLESPGSNNPLADSGTQRSFTGPNSQMQMVPRGLAQQLEHEQVSVEGQHEEDRERLAAERENEKLELARVKNFCSSLLKTLAPPLLHEYEKATGLRADAEPFTPKRVTRRSAVALAD
jgi:hypothetical protein